MTRHSDKTDEAKIAHGGQELRDFEVSRGLQLDRHFALAAGDLVAQRFDVVGDRPRFAQAPRRKMTIPNCWRLVGEFFHIGIPPESAQG